MFDMTDFTEAEIKFLLIKMFGYLTMSNKTEYGQKIDMYRPHTVMFMPVPFKYALSVF